MAKYILITGLAIAGIGRLFPGTVLDDQYDKIPRITGAGAVLWPYADATVKAASDRVLAGKGTGLTPEDAQAIMQAAVGVSNAVGATSALQTPLYTDELTNPNALAAAGLQAATATTVAPRTVLTAAMLAPGIAELNTRPRTVRITTAGGTASDAPSSAVVSGTCRGVAQTETVVVPQTATFVDTVKTFDGTGLSVAFGAAVGTGATNAIGYGQAVSLAAKIKSRANLTTAIVEVAGGVKVTTGTFVSAALSPPNGSYKPAASMDGAVDFSVLFERDPS